MPIDFLSMTARHWLPALREQLGLTKTEMARELGVTRGRVYQIEQWGGSLRGDKVAAVWKSHGHRLRAMGYTLDDIINPPRSRSEVA